MQLTWKPEYELQPEEKDGIEAILSTSFSDFYRHREYFKQKPPFRILARIDDKIVGQIGVEYRVVNLSGRPLKIFGLIDVGVLPEYRGKGIAGNMLGHVESIAMETDIDFILLFADDSRLYDRCGYQKAGIICKWLKINEHKIIGIGEEFIDELMIKATGNAKWHGDHLDLMGYVF